VGNGSVDEGIDETVGRHQRKVEVVVGLDPIDRDTFLL